MSFTLPVSPVDQASARGDLTTLLNRTLDDLAHLEFSAHQLRNDPSAAAASEFSARELDSLTAKARAAIRALRARLNRLPGLESDPAAQRDRAQSISPLFSAELANTPVSSALKRCCRRLDLALEEARDMKDPETGEIIFHLLRDLEKHLRLRNPAPSRGLSKFRARRVLHAW